MLHLIQLLLLFDPDHFTAEEIAGSTCRCLRWIRVHQSTTLGTRDSLRAHKQNAMVGEVLPEMPSALWTLAWLMLSCSYSSFMFPRSSPECPSLAKEFASMLEPGDRLALRLKSPLENRFPCFEFACASSFFTSRIDSLDLDLFFRSMWSRENSFWGLRFSLFKFSRGGSISGSSWSNVIKSFRNWFNRFFDSLVSSFSIFPWLSCLCREAQSIISPRAAPATKPYLGLMIFRATVEEWKPGFPVPRRCGLVIPNSLYKLTSSEMA